jgi:ATP-dependent DNA helicase RecQ
MEELLKVIQRHWGFRTLRPLQAQAMQAVLDGRDSLVVLPTGGGKSLCYQAPAVLRGFGQTTVVVSPLIALMKDQVDGLRACGVAAAQINSAMTADERYAAERQLRRGEVRLLFVSPERLVQTEISRVFQKVGVRTFAIDEAHCISHWGHDFRPEYRQLARLRESFPDASIHAYTATATEQVRRDIIAQLKLREPEVLVGSFDRPNLTYRVLPRHETTRQVLEVVGRHAGEAGIIYCPTRKEVDELTARLQKKGVNALPYHAGEALTDEQRKATQEAFLSERCDVVVATIAFGMGIDRSNVRFVLHTGMPKSLEHYQQETGRAGRDGLEAECVLLYSGGDVFSWKSRIQNPRDREQPPDPEWVVSSLKHLDDMDRYCRGAVCRHRALVSYFGQGYDAPSCNACDLCLGDVEEVPDAQVVAQKVLSCVARVKQGFGIGHVISVLKGQETDKVRQRGHDKLSTFGLLADHTEAELRDWVYQLIGQGVLRQVGDEYPVLRLNDGSWEVMRGKREVRLVRLVRRKKGEAPRKSKAEVAGWEGVGRELFEALRELRRELARERQVPPYLIFSDDTLRELARVKPTTPERMRQVYGVGDAKLRDFGARFLAVIAAHGGGQGGQPAAPGGGEAFELYRQGAAVEEVMGRLGVERSVAWAHLEAYVRAERPGSLAPWVPEGVYRRVADAARRVGSTEEQPVGLLLGDGVDAAQVRLVLAHLREG